MILRCVLPNVARGWNSGSLGSGVYPDRAKKTCAYKDPFCFKAYKKDYCIKPLITPRSKKGAKKTICKV